VLLLLCYVNLSKTIKVLQTRMNIGCYRNLDNKCEEFTSDCSEQDIIMSNVKKKSYIPVPATISIRYKNFGENIGRKYGLNYEENIYEEPTVIAASRLKPPICYHAARSKTANNIVTPSRRYKVGRHKQVATSKGSQNNEQILPTAQLFSPVPLVAENSPSANKRSLIPTLAKSPCNSRTSQHSVERIQSRPLPVPQKEQQRKSAQGLKSPSQIYYRNIQHTRGINNSPSTNIPSVQCLTPGQKQHYLYEAQSERTKLGRNFPIPHQELRSDLSQEYFLPKSYNKSDGGSNAESDIKMFSPFSFQRDIFNFGFQQNNHGLQITRGYNNSDTNLKRGFMWSLQDKMFARWKERFVVLTRDSLKIYKKTASHVLDSSSLLHDIPLTSVRSLSLEDRRGYLTIALYCEEKQHGKLVLRRTDGIRDWFSVLQNVHRSSKERVEAVGSMLSTEEFWHKRHFSDLGCQPLSVTHRASMRSTKAYNHHPGAHQDQDSGVGSIITSGPHSDTSSLSSRQMRMVYSPVYSPVRQMRSEIT